MAQLAKPLAPPRAGVPSSAQDSLFEQFDWLYIVCREKLFRDDTHRITNALWPDSPPAPGASLIELGCGPGFYSRNLAAQFPALQVRGCDQSERQLQYARQKTRELGLQNCQFERGDVLDLTRPDASFDYLLASRLFTVLASPDRAVTEIFRLLRAGGRCFIAEPRYKFWASIPLFAMRAVATLAGQRNGCREPAEAIVYGEKEFRALFRSWPWKSVRVWTDGRYQYALCEKA